MGAGCTKDAKGGVVDLQNGNGPETPRSPAKAVVKTEGRIQNHFEWLWLVLCNRDVNHIYRCYPPQSTMRAWNKNRSDMLQWIQNESYFLKSTSWPKDRCIGKGPWDCGMSYCQLFSSCLLTTREGWLYHANILSTWHAQKFSTSQLIFSRPWSRIEISIPLILMINIDK